MDWQDYEGEARDAMQSLMTALTFARLANSHSTDAGDGKMHIILQRNYVWYNQETRNGRWPMMIHEYEGGWEFNPVHDTVTGSWVGNEYVENRQKMSPQNAANLTDEQLQEHPFFLGFVNPEMHTSSNGLIVASNYLYRSEMLAYAIPAESFAVGANPLPGLNAYTNQVTNEKVPSRNYNMALEATGSDMVTTVNYHRY
jgi:hypothetical protein